MKPMSSQRGDEVCLARDHEVQEREVRVRSLSGFSVMARDDVIREMAGRLHIAARCEELEGADADVAQGDPCKHGARKRPFAPDCLARCDSRERARGRNPERRHRLAHDVFPKHRTKRRPAIAAPGKGRSAGTLELNVSANAVSIHDLAQQDRPAISKLRNEHSELMARIGHRERIGALRNSVACEDSDSFGRGKRGRIEIELQRKLLVQPHKLRRGDLRRSKPRIEALRKPRIAVVEGKKMNRFCFCQKRRSTVGASLWG